MNQIRAWVRQGRTDAWIAHQLEIPAAELREFRRRHGLSADGEDVEEDLRDEIEAEIEAETRAEEEAAEAEEETDEEPEGDEPAEPADGGAEGERAPQRPRRRRRRRGRGGGGAAATVQATFDHGEQDGVGLWLDPAVQKERVYTENWEGHRPVEVSIEADRITIRRSDDD